MGILVGTWKEGTIKVAVSSHWWRAKHFQGLFHSKRLNAPPQCTQFAQFCSGIKHQETSHSKLLIPILGSCCCWMIFKIALPFLFSLCCCCWGLSAWRFYPPLEVVQCSLAPNPSVTAHMASLQIYRVSYLLSFTAVISFLFFSCLVFFIFWRSENSIVWLLQQTLLEINERLSVVNK